MKTYKEFWIQNPNNQIATATKVSAFCLEVNPQITEEVRVVEYSAYQEEKEKCETWFESYSRLDDINIKLNEEIKSLKKQNGELKLEKSYNYEGAEIHFKNKLESLKKQNNIFIQALKTIGEFSCYCSAEDEIIPQIAAREALNKIKGLK